MKTHPDEGGSMLGAALGYAEQGRPVFLVHTIRGDACSCGKPKCGKKAGKHPATRNGFKDATTDSEIIRAWWTEQPDFNIGSPVPEGEVVIDIDPRHGGDATWDALEAEHGEVVTERTETPGGGYHLRFDNDGPPIRPATDRPGPGVDVRGPGSYVLLPPSVGAGGRRYVREVDYPIAPVPEWLVPLLRPTGRREDRATQGADGDTVIPAGTRDDHFFRYAVDLKKRGLTQKEAVTLMSVEWEKAEQPPEDGLDLKVALEKVERVYADEVGAGGTHVDDFDDLPDEPGWKVLRDVAAVLDRYLILPDHPHGRNAVALWIAHAHAVDCFESTPRLAALSPEPNSGKTRLLEVIESLVPGPIRTENISTAALFRVLARGQAVTVLMDEIDAVFGPKATEHEDLRGILNAGHRRDGMVYRCVGDGSRQDVTAFPVYGPVALAGLGQLPETLLSRSIVLPMRRRARDEPVEPWRVRDGGVENRLLLRRLAAWVKRHEEEIGATRPRLPAGVTDRAADVWEPLLAIAEVAGGRNLPWAKRAKKAAAHFVSQREQGEPVSLGIRLLQDSRVIFDRLAPTRKISSADLLKFLVELAESPWGNIKGNALSNFFMTKLLSGYGIRTKDLRFKVPFCRDGKWIRDDDKVLKGYELTMFEDAWERYLPSVSKESEAENGSEISEEPDNDPPSG